MDHVEVHVDIGMTIVEEVLPFSAEYYLGIRKEVDFGMLKDQLGGAGGDDDDDDDEEEDAPKPKKGGKSKFKFIVKRLT